MISANASEVSQYKAQALSGSHSEATFWHRINARFIGSLFQLPLGAWSRVLALFLGLAGVKTLLLLQFGKQLYDVHWRIGGTDQAWWDYVNFGVFVTLGVVSLLRLGRHCESIGRRAVRSANAVILASGFIFIFLTFHVSDKNYLYPIFSGVLKWGALGPYLSLDFFFHQPYLAGWMFVYAAIYYVLARTGRESRTLYVTAVFAGAYALLNLRELAFLRPELILLNCLGLASVACGWRAGQGSSFWWLIPAAWAIPFIWQLFQRAPAGLFLSYGYFAGLAGVGAVVLGAGTLLARVRGFSSIWLKFVFFYFSGFLLLANNNYPMSANFNHALCLGLESSHYFLPELLIAGCLAISLRVYCHFRPKGSFWWLDVLNVGLLTMALVDLRLSQIMGVRLEWNVLALGNSPKMIFRMARPYLPLALAGLGMLVLLYLGTIKLIRWWQQRATPDDRQSETLRGPKSGMWYAAATFVLLGLAGLGLTERDSVESQAALRLARTSPFWKKIFNRALSQDEFLVSAQRLGMGDLHGASSSAATRSPRDLNVVLVFMESTYNKYLSLFGAAENTQPLLSKYRDRMEVFPNFFSNYASSIHARFATFTGLYPVQDFNSFTLERVEVKSLFEVLRDNGYSCSLFYSSFLDITGFRSLLAHRGLDEIYDADTMPGQRKRERVSWGIYEEETLGAMRAQIKKYAQGNTRFFMTYVPAAPHYPYDAVPEGFHKFKPGEMGDYTPFYLNELLYMDWVLASLVDELKDSGLMDKTLVIITDDHGEMLGGKDKTIGHGWFLTPELANAPLIIMDPQAPGYRTNSTIGSQVDLLPTILDTLGIPVPREELYQGRSLYGPQSESGRLVYLNTYQQYAVMATNRLWMGGRDKDKSLPPAERSTSYILSNEGSKTLFKQEEITPSRPVEISEFDRFQENLLRNYSLYRQALAEGKGAGAVARR